MKNLGLRKQILLITLIPVILVDIFFTVKHVGSSIDQQDRLMLNKGTSIARQIAAASEFSLYSGHVNQIQSLLDQSVSLNQIMRASVYDPQGNLIAESVARGFSRSDLADYFQFRESILLRVLKPSADATPAQAENHPKQIAGSVNISISRFDLHQKIRQIITESIAFFIAALILAVLMTAAISRRVTGPIFAMAKHLREVETGQIGKSIEVTEGNEIGALQDGFNRMTQALLSSRRQLNNRVQQATQQLNLAITDLESSNRELGFARDLAQDANRSKSEFLANMSHEIRTPINGLKGYVHLLSQSSLDSSQRRHVEIIHKSTSDLVKIVDEILDFSKMESGKLHIIEEAFDLFEIVEQTRDLLFINVLTKGIDLHLIIFSDTPRRVIGDKLRLKQILLNLISNAIKFTDLGHIIIKVSVSQLDQDQVTVLIGIEDSGIGISEQDQQTLFKAFKQVESADTRRFSGTGLGLVISQKLAHLLGGSIAIQSTPDEGSIFTLQLPLRLDKSDPADAEFHVEIDADHIEQPSRALIFATQQPALMELRTLYDRAGVITESELIDNKSGLEPLIRIIERNLDCLDLLVFDLRHFELDLNRLLEHKAIQKLRVIVMHYDADSISTYRLDRAEFVSVINTSRHIAKVVDLTAPQLPLDEPEIELLPDHGRKVLLVDDNEINLKLASELIRLWGHQVREATNGEQAFEFYQHEEFEMIILDIQMPDIDGVSLMKMMREFRPADTTPIVALTANVLNREADRLLQIGFDHFLSKPIDETRFRALLDAKIDPQAKPDLHNLYHSASERSLDYSGSLSLCAGNEALLKQIFTILRRDIPQLRQQLEDACCEPDHARLGTIAHKLQGVTCYVSLPRLKTMVPVLQQNLADRDGDSMRRTSRKLDEELAAIDAEVDDFLERLTETPMEGQDSSTTIATT